VTVGRRTQAERSASTQARLVEAAVACLVERGWAATTTVEVCARAGVTRGAFAHHFESLPALVAAALQSVYDEIATGPPPRSATLEQLVDAAWQAVSTPRFKAMLEAWLAMANDPSLAAPLGPVVARFAGLVSPTNLQASVLDDPEARTHYLLAREAMLGLALGRATNGGRALGHEAAVLARLRTDAATLDAATAAAAPVPP
jgi:AcrR family transcriptional regulator